MHFRRNRAPFPPRTGISSVPLFTWRRKGSLARGHLPGNPPRTSQDRDPGGHIWGKSPQPAPIEGGTIFPDGRERNICHFMDGNRLCANPAPRFGGELATNEPYAHFEAGGRPSDGAGSGMGTRRDGHGAGPPRLEPELRPAFRRNGAKRGMRRASRGLGEGGRTGSRGQKCAYVRSPARRGPFPALRLAHGPFLASPPRSRAGRAVPRPDRPGSNPAWRQDPWFEPRLVAGPPARPCPNGRALARTPPNGLPIGGDRGHLATTPLNGLAEWQHPASPCETGCE